MTYNTNCFDQSALNIKTTFYELITNRKKTLYKAYFIYLGESIYFTLQGAVISVLLFRFVEFPVRVRVKVIMEKIT